MKSTNLNELKEVTAGTNVKFLFRHSVRPSLKGVSDSLSISLTEEGINLAYEFGKKLPWNIGVVSTSIANRCIQTVEQITKDSCSKHSIIPTEVLTSPAMCDFELAKQTYSTEGSLKNIAYKLSKKQSLPGFCTIDIVAEKILDYIFSVGNVDNSLDLFCTHDFNIVLLLLYLLPSIKSKELIVENWPDPLEGIFLWGKRFDLYFSWKGKIVSIHDRVKGQVQDSA